MHITMELLISKGACKKYLHKFARAFPRERYPRGVEVTVDACLQHANLLNYRWARDNLLSPEGAKAFDEAVALAQAVYDAARDAAWKEFGEVCLATWAAYAKGAPYNAEIGKAAKVCDEATAPAQRVLDKAVARAFVSAADHE